MASAGSPEYDEHLLSSAPKPDRRALQEGYDPALLNQPEPKPARPRSSTPRQAPSPTAGTPHPDVEKGLAGSGALPGMTPARATPISAPIKSKPFYKTKKGLVIIAGVLIAVIIAAVVGGVVGGRNKSSNSAANPTLGDAFSSVVNPPAATTNPNSGEEVPVPESTQSSQSAQSSSDILFSLTNTLAPSPSPTSNQNGVDGGINGQAPAPTVSIL